MSFVKSAGRALKVFEFGDWRVYAETWLNHELDQSLATQSELLMSGQEVVQ